MSELLNDVVYRRYLEQKPKLPPVAMSRTHPTGPWVVYVQREVDGKWGRKYFWKYGKALKFMLKFLEAGAHDAALNCRRVGFYPPSRRVRIKGKYVLGSDGVERQATKVVVWRPRKELLGDGQPEHHWCMYCRRPTVFIHYSRHKALGDMAVDQSVPRCCICGASARIAIPYNDRKFRVH
jgi:hypothetical protein